MDENAENEVSGKAGHQGKKNGRCPAMPGDKTADQDEEQDRRADKTNALKEHGINEDEEDGKIDAFLVGLGSPEGSPLPGRLPRLHQNEDREYA